MKKKKIGCGTVIGVIVIIGLIGNAKMMIQRGSDSKNADVSRETVIEVTTEKEEKPATTTAVKETSAKKVTTTAEKATEPPAQPITEPPTEAQTAPSVVTPEFKQLMDNYEAFFDEYINFMNNYMSNPTNAMNMLNDYMNWLNRVEETEKQMDEINVDTLLPADYAYYMEVTLRIEKKLLNVLSQ